ncbi:hypothetical protein E6C60_3857 [Paenibacillus algicola]|uniref:6-hydroxymethylpterin diphosphokinase MptE-like domain-containing protein n=1 Tax=Paenibacillus algicola TaxID=2565926 RepID=A0A4P8XNW2_9BACL|nr:6-hydroxymethylpterin diphosphokinase MptE-like protein [Paenibacillus algicola]QCT04562.1 hypothetical protein E6C60_3857 [Paenibacillus algicola]
MSILQYNYNPLSDRFPHVIKGLNDSNSLNNPIDYKEAIDRDDLWLQAVENSIKDCKIVFVYGFGRGLSIADLLDQYPDRWFFVYEPDVSLFNQTLSQYDVSLLLSHPNFYWLSVGEKQLNMLFHMVCSYMIKDLAFVALRHYLEMDMDHLRDIKSQFLEYRDTFYANKFTENRFREDWTQNYLYHIADTLHTPSIEQLFYAFEGVTAVVVSSGPSLQEDIDYLKKLKPHVLIIAAGSSIQALIKNGIQPHLTVIMDGHPINKKVFSNPNALKSPLLFTTSSYYEISDAKKHEKVHSIMKGDAVSQYFFQKDRDELLMYPTATVAGTSIQAAAYLGAKRIILAGQDLSFPNHQLYTDGINHFTNETVNTMIKSANKELPNVKGGTNLSNDTFFHMKENIERLIETLTQVEFINTSRYGAVIEGAPFQPIETLYDQLLAEKDNISPNAIGDWINENTNGLDRNRVLNVQQRVEATLTDLLIVRSEIVVLQKNMNKLRELSRTKPLKAQKKLELIENLWGSIANRDWFSPIMESIIPLQIAKFDKLLPIIITEQDLIRKTDLVYDHLGQLLVDIDERIPQLQDMFMEAIRRMDKLQEVESSDLD